MARSRALSLAAAPLCAVAAVALVFCGGSTVQGSAPDAGNDGRPQPLLDAAADGPTDGGPFRNVDVDVRPPAEDGLAPIGPGTPEAGPMVDGGSDAQLDAGEDVHVVAPDGSFACGPTRFCQRATERCVAIFYCDPSDAANANGATYDGGASCQAIGDACTGCACETGDAGASTACGGQPFTQTTCAGDPASGVTVSCKEPCGV